MNDPTILENGETIVNFNEAEKLPGSPTQQKVYLWSRKGLKSKTNGERFTLGWCQNGGKRATSLEAFGRFMDKINKPAVKKAERKK